MAGRRAVRVVKNNNTIINCQVVLSSSKEAKIRLVRKGGKMFRDWKVYWFDYIDYFLFLYLAFSQGFRLFVVEGKWVLLRRRFVGCIEILWSIWALATEGRRRGGWLLAIGFNLLVGGGGRERMCRKKWLKFIERPIERPIKVDCCYTKQIVRFIWPSLESKLVGWFYDCVRLPCLSCCRGPWQWWSGWWCSGERNWEIPLAHWANEQESVLNNQ